MTTIARWAAAIVLGAFLIFFGITKFTGGAHIFQFLEAKTGFDLFFPVVNHLVGIAEIAAGALVLIPATRHIGAVLGLGVIGGAIFFHLTWLGIATPVGFAPGAAAPWDLADFTPETTTFLFVLALIMGAVAALNVVLERPRLHALLGLAKKEPVSVG